MSWINLVRSLGFLTVVKSATQRPSRRSERAKPATDQQPPHGEDDLELQQVLMIQFAQEAAPKGKEGTGVHPLSTPRRVCKASGVQ